MHKQISFSGYIIIGTMLFGLFFGAGNMIFPLYIGQQAGGNVWLAIAGFLVSGIGLPFLGVLAIGYANAENVQQLAGRINPIYGVIFTVLLYLTIGPFFALPRTGTASYEIGIASFVPAERQDLGLAIYTLVYFICALYFALNPARLVLWVGKILTPIFLLFIVLIVAFSIISPLGYFNAPLGNYVDQSFTIGILEGYNTMDALASLAFGIIVVNAIKQYGVSEPKEIVVITAKAGLIGMLLMALIYVAMAYVGASSVDSIGLLENRGLILAKVVHYYAGNFGGFFLAILIYLACITTAIGLISACATCFHRYVPSISYKTFAVLVTILAGFIANIGLTNIIQFAMPMLMLIYPLTIALILLVFTANYFDNRQFVYVITIVFTGLVSIIESIKSAISIFKVKGPLPMVDMLLVLYSHLPLSSVGLGWILPMLLGLVIGYLIVKMKKAKTA